MSVLLLGRIVGEFRYQRTGNSMAVARQTAAYGKLVSAGRSVCRARSNTKKEEEELYNASGSDEINTRVGIGQVSRQWNRLLRVTVASDRIVAPKRSVSAK